MNAMLPVFVSSLGWALVHFVWQGALVGIAAAIALMLLRNARPQARYAVSCAALALCFALPAAGVWNGMHADATVAAMPVVNLADSRTVFFNLADTAPPASWRSTLQGDLSWIVALWSLGASLLALRMSLGMAWVSRIRRSHDVTFDHTWQARLDRLAIALGIQRGVSLRLMGSGLDTPVATGVWRPLVLVPAALVAGMPTELLEALLAHELAHVRRHDYLVNLIQSAIEALLFYHPVVWWLSRQIRIEREQIADDLAAQALGEPRKLALALQKLDQLQFDGVTVHGGTPTLSPAANGGNLMSRIQRLTRPNQHSLSLKMALPILGLTAACLTVYAHSSTPATVADSTTATTTTFAISAASAAVAATPATAASAASAASAAVDATPATKPLTKAHSSNRVFLSSDRHEDAYAVVHADSNEMNMSADSRDLPAIEKTRQKVHGDFIWVRHGGKTYVVQDPATLAKIAEAWQPVEAMSKQLDAMSAKMEAPSKQMEAMGKQMEALSGENSPANTAMEKTSAQMEALGRQQEALGAKMDVLGNKMENADDQQREVLQHQMQVLQTQMQPLERQMDQLSKVMDEHGKEMEAASKPMEDLGKQMEEASKPMEALGKQMDVLGKQEDQLGHEADQKVRALIDEAMRDGKASALENVSRD